MEAEISEPTGRADWHVRRLGRDEARGFCKEWDDLAREQPFPTIFATWEWIDTWWSNFGRTDEAWLLFVYEGEALRAILPLALRRPVARRDGVWGRVLFFCGSEEVCPDHLDLIAASEHANDALACIARHLVDHGDAWDVLALEGLAEGGNIDRHAEIFLRFWRGQRLLLARAPCVPIGGDFVSYLQAFGAKSRNTLRRRVRHLEQEGVHYGEVTAEHALAFMDEIFALHARRASAKGIRSTFAGDQVLAFHRQMIARGAANGWHWSRGLRRNGHLVAAIYGYLFNGHLAYYQIAIDPDWDSWSPGTALIYLALAEAHEGEVRIFDFLRGEEDYKARWARSSRAVIGLRIYNATLFGRLGAFWSALYQWLRQLRRRAQRDPTDQTSWKVAPQDSTQE